MLEPWIIEEIRRREQEQDEARQVPLELPLPMPYNDPNQEEASPPPDAERGVCIIEVLG